MEKLDAAASRDALEPAAHSGIRTRPRKKAARECAVVQTRAADDDRPASARINLFDRGNRIAHIARRRVFVGRLDDVNQVMGDAAALGRRHFVGADVEAAVHGRRIAADDFPAAPQRNLDAERTLARRRGTQDGEYRRAQMVPTS
jgi:hypothetical protein